MLLNILRTITSAGESRAEVFEGLNVFQLTGTTVARSTARRPFQGLTVLTIALLLSVPISIPPTLHIFPVFHCLVTVSITHLWSHSELSDVKEKSVLLAAVTLIAAVFIAMMHKMTLPYIVGRRSAVTKSFAYALLLVLVFKERVEMT